MQTNQTNRSAPLFAPEERFIRSAVGCLIRKGSTEDITVPQDLDWERVSQIASVNNLGPHLHYLFEKHPLPVRGFGQWGPLRLRQLFENIRRLRIATRLFRLFDDAGIRSVGLRGLTLANHYYPDAGLRTMKDLDILVDAEGHEQVIAALRTEGREPANRLRSQVVYLIDGVEIEIHLSLLTAKRYRAAFDRDELLRSRIPVETPEGNFYRLPAEQELLELVAHAFVHHELQGFIRIMDIALVMARSELDWKMIGRWCRNARLTNMYVFTLAFVDRLFELGCDPEAQFGKRLPSWSERMFRSYEKLYFGGDNTLHYARRVRNLFYVAERPGTKLNQFWRLFSTKTVKEMRRLAAKQRMAAAAR